MTSVQFLYALIFIENVLQCVANQTELLPFAFAIKQSMLITYQFVKYNAYPRSHVWDWFFIYKIYSQWIKTEFVNNVKYVQNITSIVGVSYEFTCLLFINFYSVDKLPAWFIIMPAHLFQFSHRNSYYVVCTVVHATIKIC